MPFGSEGLSDGIGLALSGGGFRATLFHCGALWRLTELGYLPRLSRISSVSGGSITASVLGLKWRKLRDHAFGVPTFVEEVVSPLRAYCARNVDVPSVVEGLVIPGKSIPDFLAADYARHLLGRAALPDLPDAPLFVINSTNLATGVDFRFSKPYAGDYRIGLIRNPTFTLALAVAASSAFPPFLSPVVLETDPESFVRTQGADLYDRVHLRERIMLTDGGAYDMLGIQTISNRLNTILASDAGEPFDFEWAEARDWVRHGLRVLTVVVKEARSLRKQWLISQYRRNERRGVYWGIATDISQYRAEGAFNVPAPVSSKLARIRTRLNAFNDEEQEALVNWGYAVCDAAIRSRLEPAATAPTRWPYPKHALDRDLSRKVKVEESIDLREADADAGGSA
jgi:NTE family protein